jgi:hypothetical protein
MKSFQFRVVLLAVITSIVITDAMLLVPGAARRIRERKELAQFRKEKHITYIKNNETINIFTSETPGSYPDRSYFMCKLFEYQDLNSLPISDEFIAKFVELWRENVYTKEYFPLTYDANKSINISAEIIDTFNKNVCYKTNSVTIIQFAFVLTIILLTPFIF